MPSINDFKQSFKGDIARQNRFLVFIPTPVKFLTDINLAGQFDVTRNLVFRCENAQLPGKTLATTEQRIYGPIEKHPYLATYNDIDLTFIVDDDMQQKNFFDDWLNFINPTSTNDFRYRQDYETIITVNQYTVSDDISYSVNLFNAFPVSINQLDLDWNSDGYHKLVVTFAYTRWENFTGNRAIFSSFDFTSSEQAAKQTLQIGERTLTGY